MTQTLGLMAQRFTAHENSHLEDAMLLSTNRESKRALIDRELLKPNTDYSEHDTRLAFALTESPWIIDHFLKRSRETADQNRGYQAPYESR